MLESVFIFVTAMAFILFILAIYETDQKCLWFAGTSLMMWMLIMAGVLQVTVPGDTNYDEVGIGAISLMFVILNILIMVSYFLMAREEKPFRPF